jgi:hypothetical protein
MVSQAIVLALSALGFDGWGVAASPQAGAPQAGAACAPACGHALGGHCGPLGGCPLGGCGGCGGCGCWEKLSRCVHCMNGMPQRFPYPNPDWGYYFFRPYNYTVLREQQAEIVAMGGNPIQPYDNRFFERIYQEVEALPAASPVPEPYPVPPPAIPPTVPIPPSDPLPPPPAVR